ncbi:ABC transporter ATP-binding protein [Streptomyces sp. M19]
MGDRSAPLPAPALRGQQQRLALASALVTGPRCWSSTSRRAAWTRHSRTPWGARCGNWRTTGGCAAAQPRPAVGARDGGPRHRPGARPSRRRGADGGCTGRGHPRSVRGALRRSPSSDEGTPRRRTPYRRGPGAGPEAGCPDLSERRGVMAEDIAVRRRSADPLAGPVSMAFPPGTSTALLGPSGAGKTTFARVLAGLTTPTRARSGTTADRSRPYRAPLGRAAPRCPVRAPEQRRILRGTPPGPRPTRRLRAAAARLGRRRGDGGGHRDGDGAGTRRVAAAPHPGRLSGGQLQRCALVRALTARPALLVCDEVTSALDTVSRERVLDALPRLLAPSGQRCSSSATTWPPCGRSPKRPYSSTPAAPCAAAPWTTSPGRDHLEE